MVLPVLTILSAASRSGVSGGWRSEVCEPRMPGQAWSSSFGGLLQKTHKMSLKYVNSLIIHVYNILFLISCYVFNVVMVIEVSGSFSLSRICVVKIPDHVCTYSL